MVYHAQYMKTCPHEYFWDFWKIQIKKLIPIKKRTHNPVEPERIWKSDNNLQNQSGRHCALSVAYRWANTFSATKVHISCIFAHYILRKWHI